MKESGVKFLAEACGGSIIGKVANTVKAVKIDSREIGPGEMFVAVIGENNDGHDYLKEAYARGSRVFLVSDKEKSLALLRSDASVSLILASDTVAALRNMASAYLNQFSLKRVAVTGSVGKTTTRALTAAVLAQKYRTVSAEKNLNTDLGTSITAFSADESTELIVFEMGMDRRHEIEGYCDWIKPSLAIVTNIGISHLEYLGTRDEIAREKLSITKYLAADDYLIYQCDGDYLKDDAEMRSFALGSGFKSFRVGREGDLSASDVRDLGPEGISFSLRFGDEIQPCRLPLAGIHNADNASLAAAAGLITGVSLSEAAAAFAGVSGFARRMDVQKCGEVTIIDDSYNASPQSVMAAIDFLSSCGSRRRIAVLGTMRELGSESESGHLQVGRHLAGRGIDILVTIGDEGRLYAEGARGDKALQSVCFDNADMAQQFLFGQIKPGDAVLLKGSNITCVASVAENLRKHYRGE